MKRLLLSITFGIVFLIGSLQAQYKEGELPENAWKNAIESIADIRHWVALGRINKRDKYNRTVLEHAIRAGEKKIVSYLLSNRANPNEAGSLGKRPLMIAIENNEFDIAKLLVHSGAKVSLKDNKGKSVLDYVKKSRFLEEEKEFFEMAIEPSERDFASAKSIDTIAAYKHYIEKYPNGDMSKEAKDRISVLEFRKIKLPSKKSYMDFIKKFPESSKRQEVKHYIMSLEADITKKLFAKIEKRKNLKSYKDFVKKYPYSKESKYAIEYIKGEGLRKKYKIVFTKIQRYLKKRDIKGFISYIGSDSDVKNIALKIPKISLLLSGPEEMMVLKVLHYKKQGLGDAVLASKIKSLGKPYKDFSFDEILSLKKFGMTDVLLAAMLDATTAYKEKVQRQREQKIFIAKQEAIAKGMQEAQAEALARMQQEKEEAIANAHMNQSNQNQAGGLADDLVNKAAHRAMDSLLDHLF